MCNLFILVKMGNVCHSCLGFVITIMSKEPLVEFFPSIIIDRARGLSIGLSDGGIFLF